MNEEQLHKIGLQIANLTRRIDSLQYLGLSIESHSRSLDNLRERQDNLEKRLLQAQIEISKLQQENWNLAKEITKLEQSTKKTQDIVSRISYNS